MADEITNVGKNFIRDVLKGDVTDGQIKYIAWGDDGTANPSPNTMTALGNELGRHAVTGRSSGGIGVLQTIIYLAPEDAVEDIEEIGFFAGEDASSTPDSGVMVARFLYSKSKPETQSLQIVLQDTIDQA